MTIGSLGKSGAREGCSANSSGLGREEKEGLDDVRSGGRQIIPGSPTYQNRV